MPKQETHLAGIPGSFCLPYAKFAGIDNFLSPPTAIPFKPWSQPLMTSPRPRTKVNGDPAVLESNCFPLVNLPMYLAVSLLLDEAMTMDIPHGESLAWLGDGSGTGFDVLVLESGSECPLISQL